MILGNPSILYFLGLLAIPIIIHFFHFRKHRKVYFSDISLLKTVQEEKKSRRNIKHWILLLLRLLAIACIVLAFARPYTPLSEGATNTNETIHAVYIDNSFSMNAEGVKGKLIESSKKESYDLTQSLDATDEVFLISNDFVPEHMRVQDIRTFQSNASGITTSASTPLFSEVVSAVADIIFQREQREQANLYVFSDFQKSQFDFQNVPKSDALTYNFIVKDAEQESNIYIDSIWIESPVIKLGQPIPLSFKVVNESQNNIQDIPIYLEVNGMSKGVTNISIPSQSSITDQIVFVPKEAGYAEINLFLEDASITFDDNFYAIIPIKEKIDVLLIHDENSSNALEKLYALDNYYAVENVSLQQVNVDINDYDLVVFNDIRSFPEGLIPTVQAFVQNGGNVVATPSANATAFNSFNQLLTQLGGPQIQSKIEARLPLAQIDYDLSFFENIFESEEDITMPVIGNYYQMSNSGRGYLTHLLQLKNGNPFLTEVQNGQGFLYWQAAPIFSSSGNWSNHALLSAIYLRIAERSVEKFPLYYTIGSEQNMQVTKEAVRGDQNIIHVSKDDQELMTTEVQKVGGKNMARIGIEDYSSLQEAGFYQVTKAQQTIQKIAFNYSRVESKMNFYTLEEIKEEAEQNGLQVGQVISTKNQEIGTINTATKKEYWRILLILGIVFLIGEILINRLWKTT